MASQGVEFDVPVAPDIAARTISSIHGGGARATAKRILWGIDVTASGRHTFTYTSRIGDRGVIEVANHPSGARVRARATSLYVGSPPRSVSRRATLWGFASRLTHVLYTILGITPGAAKLKRFHNAFQRRLLRELSRSGVR